MNYTACTLKTTNPIIVLQENKSRLEIRNAHRIELSQIMVDGCLIDKKLEKCDWLITYDTPRKTAIYIELKGCDLDKAISQLKSTLTHTTPHLNQYKKECYAVTTRVPKHGATIRKRCLEFHKSTGATLSVKNTPQSIEIGP
ncbi:MULTISPECIES: hypothetical protein [Pseudomonas]|uniref:hypothetical protein n=1 Tax=Pseudomonas TaxID=286 RepID=UPI0012E2A16F|nr:MULTISPECIES: hypothetical protein [Pseudomonas]